MHTNIKLNKSLGRVLRYHERKVKQGKGECLYAGNMLKEAKELTLREKQFFIERLYSLNDRVGRKALHIFLSWHRNDVLDDEKMRTISKEYMERMGLGRQPYLVYRHWDMPHPHAHIVSTNIRRDGRKIELWQRQYFQSLKHSRELEKKYGLYQAGRSLPDEEWSRQNPVQKVVYGKTPLKPTMNAVVKMVLDKYRYTSLEELNALLREYNILASRRQADRGNGVLYYPLSEVGEKENVYVKASAMRCKPTLARLEESFSKNRPAYEEGRQRVTAAIDWIFYKQAVNREAFQKALQKERIRVTGDPERPFYIDEATRTVYAGETLGVRYTALGLQERLSSEDVYQQAQVLKQQQTLRQRPRLNLH